MHSMHMLPALRGELLWLQSLPSGADRHLTRIFLTRVRVPPIQHLARIHQARIALGRNALRLGRGPARLVNRAIAERLCPDIILVLAFADGGVGCGGGSRGESGLVERGAPESGGGADVGQVRRVAGLDDVVGDEDGALCISTEHTDMC